MHWAQCPTTLKACWFPRCIQCHHHRTLASVQSLDGGKGNLSTTTLPFWQLFASKQPPHSGHALLRFVRWFSDVKTFKRKTMNPGPLCRASRSQRRPPCAECPPLQSLGSRDGWAAIRPTAKIAIHPASWRAFRGSIPFLLPISCRPSWAEVALRHLPSKSLVAQRLHKQRPPVDHQSREGRSQHPLPFAACMDEATQQ